MTDDDADEQLGQAHHPRRRWGPAVAAFGAAALLAAGAGLMLWKEYDPFVTDRPDVREAHQLTVQVAAGRELDDVQFEQALNLLAAESALAQLKAITVVHAAGQRPDRRERALASLEQVAKDAANERVRKSAALTAARLRETAPLRD